MNRGSFLLIWSILFVTHVYAQQSQRFWVLPSRGQAGSEVLIWFDLCSPNDTFEVRAVKVDPNGTVHPEVLIATLQADDSGIVRQTVTIGTDAQPGTEYHIHGKCVEANVSTQDESFKVLPPPMSPPPTPTPTSSPTTPPPPIAEKPGVFDDVGKNAFIGGVGGGVSNALTGVGELSLGWGIVASGLAVGASSGVATFLWNIGENLFDPSAHNHPMTEGAAWAVFLLTLALLGLTIVFSMLRAWKKLSLSLVGFVGIVSILTYWPSVAVTNRSVFNFMPVAAFIVGAFLICAVRLSAALVRHSFQKLVIVTVPLCVGMAITAIVVDYASGWEFEHNRVAVGLVFSFFAGLVEQLILRGRKGLGLPKK